MVVEVFSYIFIGLFLLMLVWGLMMFFIYFFKFFISLSDYADRVAVESGRKERWERRGFIGVSFFIDVFYLTKEEWKELFGDIKMMLVGAILFFIPISILILFGPT